MASAIYKSTKLSNEKKKKYIQHNISINITEEQLSPWYYCCICNHQSALPVCCINGDVFCKECLLRYMIENSTKVEKSVEIEDKDQKEINKFLDSQKIISVKSDQEIDTNSLKKEKMRKKRKAKCPRCFLKLKLSEILPLDFKYIDGEGACSICHKKLVGVYHAFRIGCSHIICGDCLKNCTGDKYECPICNIHTNKDDIILLNKVILDKQDESGKIFLTKQKLATSYG